MPKDKENKNRKKKKKRRAEAEESGEQKGKRYDVDMDRMRREAEEAKKRRTSGGSKFVANPFYDLDIGDNVMRILPPWGKTGEWCRKVWKHFNVPTKDGKTKTVVQCYDQTFPDDNITCPICESLIQLRKEGHDVYRMEASCKVYVNAIIRNDAYWKEEDLEDVEDDTLKEKFLGKPKVQIVGLPLRTYDDLVTKIVDPDYGNIVDPEEGYDVNVIKTGKKRNGKVISNTIRYKDPDIVPRKKPIFDDEEDQEFVLDNLVPLDKKWTPPDNEILAEVKKSAKRVTRYVHDNPDEFKDKGRGRGRGKSTMDSDSDDDLPEADDSDDEVRKPKRDKKRNKKAESDSDDDISLSDSDDDRSASSSDSDDEVKPRSKKPSKKSPPPEDSDSGDDNDASSSDSGDEEELPDDSVLIAAIKAVNELSGKTVIAAKKSEGAKSFMAKLESAAKKLSDKFDKKKFRKSAAQSPEVISCLVNAGFSDAKYIPEASAESDDDSSDSEDG